MIALLLRAAGAGVLVLVGLLAGTLAMIATGRPDRTATAVAVVVYVAAFQALRLLRPPTAPGVPRWPRYIPAFRAALGYAALIDMYLLWGIGRPPYGRAELGSAVPLVAIVALSVGAATLARKAPGASAVLAALPAGYACFVDGKLLGGPGWGTGRVPGPAATLAFGLAASSMAASFSAATFTSPLWPPALGGSRAAA